MNKNDGETTNWISFWRLYFYDCSSQSNKLRAWKRKDILCLRTIQIQGQYQSKYNLSIRRYTLDNFYSLIF